MGATSRFIIRWGLIGGLAVGGITLLVGPQRVMACLDQLRKEANSVVENLVEDPVALRRQLDNLAKQYPTRLAFAPPGAKVTQTNTCIVQYYDQIQEIRIRKPESELCTVAHGCGQ